jgi:acetylornithine deacetylase/succinyl-diaminopimelate desuccinylase-like protein
VSELADDAQAGSEPRSEQLAELLLRLVATASSLDTRWYSQLGIPAFAYGGGRLDVSHRPDEYIDEAAMRRCAAVYALFAVSGWNCGARPRG